MNYVKSCLIITMLLGVQIGYSQCDANGDGDLDILDILTNVSCILEPGCWEGGSDTTMVQVGDCTSSNDMVQIYLNLK